MSGSRLQAIVRRAATSYRLSAGSSMTWGSWGYGGLFFCSAGTSVKSLSISTSKSRPVQGSTGTTSPPAAQITCSSSSSSSPVVTSMT